MHDLGGALSLKEAAKALAGHHALRFILSEYSKNCLKEKGLSDSSEVLPSMVDVGTACDRVDKFKPDIIMSGTSWNSNIEQVFRNIAFKKNIPSIVYIDYWSNYRKRFKEAAYPIKCTKDTICVIDDHIKAAMVKEGFPPGNIHVTGSPYYDHLINARDELEVEVKKIRRELHDSPDQKVITFFSEHITPAKMANGCVLSVDLVKEIKKILAEKALCSKVSTKLLIKIHPKEEKKEFEDIAEEVNGYFSSAILQNEYSSIDLIMASEFVVGQTTTPLVEARMLSKPVASILQNNRNMYSENMDRLGIPVLNLSDLEEVVYEKKALFQKDSEMIFKNSSGKIIGLLNINLVG
jgi:hypothetical protein